MTERSLKVMVSGNWCLNLEADNMVLCVSNDLSVMAYLGQAKRNKWSAISNSRNFGTFSGSSSALSFNSFSRPITCKRWGIGFLSWKISIHVPHHMEKGQGSAAPESPPHGSFRYILWWRFWAAMIYINVALGLPPWLMSNCMSNNNIEPSTLWQCRD